MDLRILKKPSPKKQIDTNKKNISPAIKYTVDIQTALEETVSGASFKTKYSGTTEIVVKSVKNIAPPTKIRLNS